MKNASGSSNANKLKSTKQSSDETSEILQRYNRASNITSGLFSTTLVKNVAVYPNWTSKSGCFWYIRHTEEGKCYRLVDAGAQTNEEAFCHVNLADLLVEATGSDVDPFTLPISKLDFDIEEHTLEFTTSEKRWRYDIRGKALKEINLMPREWLISPDGKLAAFSKDNNIWLRDLKTKKERALTNDGEAENVYGVAGKGWGRAFPSIILEPTVLQARWSPDSKRLFTVQRDTRSVEVFPVVHHVPEDGSVRPMVEELRIAFPGDENIETLRLLVIEVGADKVINIDYRQLPAVRNTHGFFNKKLGWWHKDNRLAYFVDVDRYQKYAKVVELDTYTGKTKVLFEETSGTYISLMLNSDMLPVLTPLPETNELLWYSERTGWAHLYLYDLDTGQLKNAVTQGDWVMRDIVRICENNREIVLQTSGRVEGRDPYYRDVVRVDMDSGELETIIGSDHEYYASAPNDMQFFYAGMLGGQVDNGASPCGKFIVVTRSRVDKVPISFLIDHDGNKIMVVEKADISGLPQNWQWPEPVCTQSADGEVDIYGVVYRPSNFDKNKKYPVVSYLFSTAELPWVPKGAFDNSAFFGMNYFDPAALAELGFIVVQFDGRGVPFRSKAFHDASYGWMESASDLADHVAGIKQLASIYPQMDIENVGVTTQASGGPGGIQGLLQYPDFYKVAVQSVMHDSRLTGGPVWGDLYEGKTRIDHPYPEDMVDRMKGKLLLTHGMADWSCPPANTFRLIDALATANKDFDMIFLPKLGHSPSPYFLRRSWDFLVRHLRGEVPPEQFNIEVVDLEQDGLIDATSAS